MRRAELLMAVVMACFSLYLMWKSTELPIGWIAGEGPGGGAFPFWLALGMLARSIWTLMRWKRGVTPAAQSTAPYMDGAAQRLFLSGTGNLNGVVAPEAANNAASTGSMLPMLTLGIPGSPTTAILLGGMVIWGIEPGPLLFVENQSFVWGLIASLYTANFVALITNIAFIPAFIWVLKLPFTILAPIIFILCVVGGYAPTQTMHDVWLMLAFGVAGYLLRKLDYPMAPAVLAIVLGPLFETSMRQALLMSGGSFRVFFERPIAGVIMVIAILLFALPLFGAWKNRMKGEPTAG